MNNIEINSKVSGRFSITVKDKEGNLVKDKCFKETKNIVVDGALSTIFTTPDGNPPIYAFDHSWTCVAGTGTSAITASSTGLTTPIASSAQASGSSANDIGLSVVDNGDDTDTWTRGFTYEFAIGAFSGETLGEVGIYSNYGFGSELFIAGQQIKDGMGDPTTITVLSDEQLTVEYAIDFVTPNVITQAATGTFDNKGTPVGYSIDVYPFRIESIASGYTGDFALSRNIRSLAGRIDFSNGDFWAPGSATYKDSSYSVIGTTTPTSSVIDNGISGTISAAPADFSSSDIKVIHIGRSGSGLLDDPYSGLGQDVILRIVFDSPVEKTSSDSLTLDFDLTYTLTRV